MLDLRGAVVQGPDADGFYVLLAPGYVHPAYLEALPGVEHAGDMWYLPANLVPPQPTVVERGTLQSGIQMRDYQVEALNFCLRARGGAVLALDVGLGKTPVAAAVAQLNPDWRPFLVIGPLLSMGAWVGPDADPEKYFGLTVAPLRGKTPNSMDIPKADGYFINYEIVGDWQWWLESFAAPLIIIDEAHVIRNARVKFSRVVRKLCRLATTKKRLLLTATPIVNRISDLWVLLDAVQPRAWGYRPDFLVRYCLGAGTQILTGRYQTAAIEQLRVGDTVIGYEYRVSQQDRSDVKYSLSAWRFVRTKVTAIHRHWDWLWRLTMDDGTVTYQTRDHKWFTNRSPDKNPAAPYRTIATLRTNRLWSTALSRCGLSPAGAARTPAFITGWLRGVVDGDGHIRVRRAAFNERVSVCYPCTLSQHAKNYAVITRAKQFAAHLGWRTTERKEEATSMHTASFAKIDRDGRVRTRPCYELFTAEYPDGADHEFWSGWLAGIYDAEGYGAHISQSQEVNPETYARIGLALEYLKFDAAPLRDKRCKYAVGWRIRGGRDAVARLAAWITLPRKLDVRLLGTIHAKPVGIATFEKTGILAPVYNITTETGNYIANGLASKNCGAIPGEYSDWVETQETNVMELRDRMEHVLIRRSRFDVRKELPAFSRQITKVPTEALELGAYREYLDAKRDIVSTIIQRGGKLMGVALQMASGMHSALSRAKAQAAAEEATHLAAAEGAVVVFTWYKDTGKAVAKALKKAKCLVFGPVSSSTTKKKRDEAAQSFKAIVKDGNVPSAGVAFVATLGTAGMSLNELAVAPCALFVDLYWVPAMLLQAEGRIHREGQLAASCFVQYLLVDGSIDEVMYKHLERKARAISRAAGDSGAISLVESLGGVEANAESDMKAFLAALAEIQGEVEL